MSLLLPPPDGLPIVSTPYLGLIASANVAERTQTMGHHQPQTYDNHYPNKIYEADTLNGLLIGSPLRLAADESLPAICSLTRDHNAPSFRAAKLARLWMEITELLNPKLDSASTPEEVCYCTINKHDIHLVFKDLHTKKSTVYSVLGITCTLLRPEGKPP